MRRALLLAMLLPLSVGAQVPKGHYFQESEEEKPWQEQKLQMPPAPKEQALVKVDVGGLAAFDFFVDLASVSVGRDGVIRYTLLARSESGAKNLSFEGIKCKGRERKIYAIGRSDGTWVQARNPNWDSILGSKSVQAKLADEFFCPRRTIVGSTAEALDALRRGGHPRGYVGPDN